MLQVVLAGVLGGLLYLVFRPPKHNVIAELPGPPAGSWLVGNRPDWQRPAEAGVADAEWIRTYGTAVRTKGCFGEDVLFLADPKALQHVFSNLGSRWSKPPEQRAAIPMTMGHGIVWADGATHARHRKIMNPSFSNRALKGYLTVFQSKAKKLVQNLGSAVETGRACPSQPFLVDVEQWLGKATLDIIGETAFGFKFDTLGGIRTRFYDAYRNLFPDSAYAISNAAIVFRRVLGFFPWWLVYFVFAYLPSIKSIGRQRRYMKVTCDVAQEIIDAHQGYERGKVLGKDVMAMLVQANLSENPSSQLSNDEVKSQIATLLLSGHETTANTTSWLLWELARHPEAQSRVRLEARDLLLSRDPAAPEDFTREELESMVFTQAVMKETLRMHPIVIQLFRVANQEDTLPLQIPQRTTSGQIVDRIPVSRGQLVHLSLGGYNRLKSVWGDDAGEWRPERWLMGGDHACEDASKTNVGVYSNLLTFGSGLRSCIGWRFALLEIQALLTPLILNFRFTPPSDIEIKRAVAQLMVPMVEGREHEGVQLPLGVVKIEGG